MGSWLYIISNNSDKHLTQLFIDVKCGFVLMNNGSEIKRFILNLADEGIYMFNNMFISVRSGSTFMNVRIGYH